eukprot:GILI01006961.1.p2 GENE.GILI01006961.1~~GILI01006961.1.p2  ORF type:complete len:114 (+),score=43.43 GILI01006961.1:45-386(+)
MGDTCSTVCIFGYTFGIMWAVVIAVFLIEYGMFLYFGDPAAIKRGEAEMKKKMEEKAKRKAAEAAAEVIESEVHIETLDTTGNRQQGTNNAEMEHIIAANETPAPAFKDAQTA